MMKSARKIIAVLILIVIPLAVYGLWRWRNGSKPAKSDSPQLEDFQALPYVQWTKNESGRQSGVTQFDRTRAWNGLNVYTNDVDTAFLMDMAGKRLHSWHFGKKKKCEYAHLLPNGEMLGVCMGQGIWKVDWDSNGLWRNRFFVHHDIEPVPDGTFWTIGREPNIEYKGRRVVFDALQRLSESGELLEKWYTFDHLDELQKWHKPTDLDVIATEESPKKFDYYHLNTVKLLPENPHAKSDRRFQQGNILICLRNANLIAILDKDSKKIVWTYGPDMLDWPHLPVMLPNGNILIFDNGLHRKWSRVIEINPITKKVVWNYGDSNKGFFSGLQGSAQRLPNGNTLICESMKGHVFEVDSAGSILWEFWNPEMNKENRKTIYRFMRVPVDSIPREKLSRIKR